jgi:hypothetical protein
MKSLWHIPVVVILTAVILFSCVTQATGQHSLAILFYNTENFFDPYDDSLTLDESFTPAGDHRWTFDRFRRKADHLYKLFLAVGDRMTGWDPPALIALAEVENHYVLHYLLHDTPFSKFPYGIVHYESPDRRGIDVALLYDRRRVEVLASRPLPVRLPEDSLFVTRDILYVLTRVDSADTLSLFINHWPSRRGGYLVSESRRIAAAQVLLASLDTLSLLSGAGRVVVVGDLNDEPSDPSVKMLTAGGLVNLMEQRTAASQGTLFYDGRWWFFDQFLVSPVLTGKCSTVEVIRFPFLFDPQQKGRPWRTYAGLRYLGGFSDHLPVALMLDPYCLKQ